VLPVLKIEEAFPNRIAAVVRTDDSQKAFHACVAAVEGGVGTLEVTTGVPEWTDVVRGLAASTGVPVGVGTVLTVQHVEQAKAVGAAFVVTPLLLPEIAKAAKESDLLCVMGALTPTEIFTALRLGVQIVKVFPVAAMGGPAYLRYLAGPLPGMPLWVSGGVEIEQVAEYLKLGVKAIGLTTAIFDPAAVAAGKYDQIRDKARAAVSALAGVA
jgi:2-dehydro-3-deoxyphosphogluconate aldolase/(4S)-4-hydroxy-2-oxoglutarate aldolase